MNHKQSNQSLSKSRRKRKTGPQRKKLDPFPASATVNLHYTHVRSFGSSSLSFIYNAYNYNSAYDPDDSGVGAQPLAYDQWSAFYTRYFVDEAVIDVTASNATSNAIIFGIIAQLDNSPQTDVAALISSPLCKWTVLSPVGSGEVTRTISMRNNIRTLYANPAITDALDDFTGVTGNFGSGSSPLRNGFFHVFFSTLDGAILGTNAVKYIMRLTQHTKFSRRQDIAQS